MSRQSVRAAVQAYFAPTAVAGLNTVYRAQPRVVNATDYFAGDAAGVTSGMVAYPFIERESEHRQALTGTATTGKLIKYEVGLVLRFFSNQPLMEDAQDDFDTTVELIKLRLRTDRKLGTLSGAANEIWQAGEGDSPGGDDIEVMADLPKTEKGGGKGGIVIWGVVRFTCLSWSQ